MPVRSRRVDLFIALVTWCLASGCAVSARDTAERGWYEVQSQHFEIVSSVGAKAAADLAQQMEDFDRLARSLSNVRLREPVVPTRVYVFEHGGTYQAFEMKDTIGFFFPGWRHHTIVLNAGNLYASGREIGFHEYVHWLLERSGAVYPRWYEEGLAEFLSTVHSEGAQATLGRPPLRGSLARLKAEAFGLSRRAETGSHVVLKESEQQKEALFYARSWAMVHFCLLGHLAESQVADRRAALGEFLALLNEGQSEAEAFLSAFGKSEEEVQKDLYAYVRRDRYQQVRVPVPPAPAGERPIKATRLPAADVACTLGELSLARGKIEQAAALFRQALAQNPDHACAIAGVAAVRSGQKQYQAATTELERALTNDPERVETLVDVARHLFARSAQAAATNDEIRTWQKQARVHLTKAIALAPGAPEAYVLLAWSHTWGDADVSKGLAAATKADALVPYHPEVYVVLGMLYKRAGQLARARVYLSAVKRLRHAGGWAQRAKELLSEIDESADAPEPPQTSGSNSRPM